MLLDKIIVKPQLSRLLRERGLTQMQLQELSGVPQATISRFDTNKRHECTHLFAIAKALGINVEALFVITYRQ